MKKPIHVKARPRLSVAMIVRDAQEAVTATLQSVRPIADEMVVLDTGSTDATVALARRHGARVHLTNWTDDFSVARNQCSQLTMGDWILWLDAGERLPLESAMRLRCLLDEKADLRKVYTLAIETPPASPDGASEQMRQVRLLPRAANLQYRGRVRETLRPSIEAAALSIDSAPGILLRDARCHDSEQMARKAARDLQLATLEAEESGHWPLRLLLALGEAHSSLGNREKAREVLRNVIRTAEQGSAEMLAAYYELLVTFDGDEPLHAVQLSTCLEALEVFPFDGQLLLAMGKYLLSRERPDLAVRSFEAAVRFGKAQNDVWHLVEWKELAAVCQALSLQLLGRETEAQRGLERFVESGPTSVRVRQHLLNLYVKQGETDRALETAQGMDLPADRVGPFREAVLGACKAARQEWTPALGHLQSAYLLGCRGPFCLRWLATTLLSNGQVDAARPVLDEWQRLEPNHVELRAYLEAIEQIEPDPADSPEGTDDRLLRVDAGDSSQPPSPASILQTSPLPMAESLRSHY